MAVLALGGALASPAAAWRASEIGSPTGIDVVGTQVASSAAGAAASSFNTVNIDAQVNASAFVAVAPPQGLFGAAVSVPGVQEVLALAYSGSTLEILAANGQPGQPCCATVVVIPYRPGSGFGPAQTLAAGAGGGTTGALVPLAGGRTLAVIASPQRLWASEAGAGGHFGPVHGLTPAGVQASALAATGTGAGAAVVAWTQGASRQVRAAFAGPGRSGWRTRTLLSVRAGRTIDGLQLVSRPDGATLAWTDSFTDGAGAYRAGAAAADITGVRLGRRRGLSSRGEVVAGLTLSGDGFGDEVAAWDSCRTASGDCVVKATVRNAPPAPRRSRRGRGRRPARPSGAAPWFGRERNLGSIDAGESPQLTMAPDRASLLGWISGGRLVLSGMPPRATRFGPAGPLSGDLAGNPALGFGPGGVAVATWTQGTFSTAVFAAVAR